MPFVRRLMSYEQRQIYRGGVAEDFLDDHLPGSALIELWELCLDIFYLLVFVVAMAIHPIRGLALVHLLLEPLPRWNMRLWAKAVDLIDIMAMKKEEYVAHVNEVATVALKEIVDMGELYVFVLKPSPNAFLDLMVLTCSLS
jgi:hypothetical protein